MQPCHSIAKCHTTLSKVIFCLFCLSSLLLGVVSTAQAGDFCSSAPYNGIIDGDVLGTAPTQITIDTDCTFQNWPQSNPLTTTINFQTNDPTQYLIVFDQTIFTGHMACASVDHKIWFANSSDYGSSNACQDLFIPVETIDKQNPTGQTTATIGVPFTYTLTLPSMNWPAGDPSNDDLNSVTLWDDISRAATGADLTFVSIDAYYKGSGIPVTLVPETDPNAPGGVWTTKNLSYEPIPSLYAGNQIVVEITVVLDDVAANAPGTQFVNTAKWSFGRDIDVNDNGTIDPDEHFEPLPGEWGISQPMTIVEPDLVVTKMSSETALNLGVQSTFTIDVQNTGGGDAWNATILDQLPNEADGGMCDFDPTSTVTAQIRQGDGTLVSDLTAGTDFSVSYSPCLLSLSMLSNKAKIEPSQHLIVIYESELDGDSIDGVTLTNVAGATQWFNGHNSYPDRLSYTKTLTDGTPEVLDFQDSETVTTALSGYYFQKTVADLTSSADPATTAAPGDDLHYRLRLFNVDETIDGITISDVLDSNSFDLTTFAITSLPTNATYSFDSVTGLLEITGNGVPLNVAAGEELVIEFDISLKSSLTNDTEVDNQASLTADQGTSADTSDDINALSDDPYVNGIAAPGELADPTTLLIQSPGPLAKATTQASVTIGEAFTYRITVPATAVDVPLYDVRILDDLNLSAADLSFVSASVVSGGSWSLSNTGTDTNLVIEDTATGIDIPAGGQAVIDITVQLQNTASNVSGLSFVNSAFFSYNRRNGDAGSQTSISAAGSGAMTVVEPLLVVDKAVSYFDPSGKPISESAAAGDVLKYVVTVTNSGNATAYDVSVVDTLPAELSLVADSATATINSVPVSGFVKTPTDLGDGALTWGQKNSDLSLDIPVGQSMVLTYRTTVDTVTSADIANSVYVDWTSLDGGSVAERTGGGCPTSDPLNDYCDGPATASVSTYDDTSITKAVVADSYAETPASSGDPVVRVGDTVTYQLTLSLQDYVTRDLVVKDALPGGMELASFTISGGADFTYTPGAQPAAGATGTLSWEFGDISNPPGGDETLVIQYVARVVTDAAPTGVANDTSITRENQAQLFYTGGDPATYPDRLTATETIEVRQPQMSAITKVDLGSGRSGSGTVADPYQVNIATDVMDFQLSSCNEGLAPAYGVIITDQLASQFDETDLSTNRPVVKVDGTTLLEGTDYNLTLPGRGGELRIELQDSAPVNPGECVTVDYSIGFHTDLTSSTTWSNQAELPEYRSLPLSESGRIYTSTDTAQVWMINLVNGEQLLKTLVSSEQATVGDEVVYRITVPAVPVNTSLDSVVVTDTLHGALEYVGATAVDGGGSAVSLTDNSLAPGQVSLVIANIPAGGQVIITLTTRVANNDQANAGVSFTNTASYSYTDIPADLDTASTSGPLTIVEPALTIAKAAANVSNPGAAPNPGDVLRYSLTFTAGGGATGDDFSDVFDLLIEDSLSLGMIYLSGTATVDGAGNTIDDPAVTGDGTTTSQTLTWSLGDLSADIEVPEGTVVTVTYDVEVLSGVQPGQDLTNSATVQWTGQDGDNAFERTGSGTPAENDYVAGPATTSLRTELEVSLVKSVVNVNSTQDPGTDAEPGHILHYTLVLSNQSLVPLTNGILVDHLDPWFAAGSLVPEDVIVSDAGADTSNIDAGGGDNGTGLLDIRNLTLAAQGDTGDTVTIEFEATLAAAIDSGTSILNQAQLSGDGLTSVTSNQTSTLISSAPAFEVWKTSQDLSGDPDDLKSGDTLRYTIRVKNIGNENAVNAVLQDQIPTYTTYVAGTTRLNGSPAADPSAGVSALESGMLINAPEDSTPGSMRADASATTSNVATITFDVTVNNGVVDGAIISNQGFFNADGAGSGAAPREPSDDPDTASLDDPTIDIVGKVPLVDALKTVSVDGGGQVDPGDTLNYTITISNTGTAPTTGVVFTDAVPANTTYVAGSTTLNGNLVSDPAVGVSPLIAGIDVSSSDLPLPDAGEGTLSAGFSAEITFSVTVNAGVAAGTIISNQGTVSSTELLDEPTDADGDDSNGDQPTEVVVGNEQYLSIIKQVSVVGGGSALPGSQLEYLIRVTNIGSEAATSVVISDDLDDLADPDTFKLSEDQVSYVTGSARLDGSTAGVSFDGSLLSADYAGSLPAGGTTELRFRVQIDTAVAAGTTLTNKGVVSWDGSASPAIASVSLDVGGTPGSATLNGSVWHDADLDKEEDSGERQLENWSVSLYRNGQLLATTLTDVSGAYQFSGMTPNDGTSEYYELRFRAAGAGPNTPSLGYAHSTFTDGPQLIQDINIASGGNLQNLNLPLWPNGTVYNSIVREPVSGASLVLKNATTDAALPGTCFDDPLQQNQLTAQDGFYKFDLNFSDAACPAAGTYLIEVTPPASGYLAGQSLVIPPASDATTEPFSVPSCPGNGDDAVPSTVDYCEMTASAMTPPISVLPRTAGTLYQLHLLLNNASMPGHSQLFNNSIPLDPVLDGAVAITKTASLINVTRGELVPYTITVTNVFGVPLYDLSIVDLFPAGFKYVSGSARLDGKAVEPEIDGRELVWDDLELQVNGSYTLKLLLVVGSGVSEGEYVNRALVLNSAMGTAVSGEASATVQVVPDPDFDCTDVIGKVFDDRNLNGWQEGGEKGLPGARVATARGLIATSDEYGRFHITCATVPDRDRGSNFILKLDERSLPSGYRLTTENPRVQRATRGKMLRFNFGATIHRIVRMDIADGVFEPGTSELRPQWQPKIGQLLGELWKSPAVLRLSYLADVEPEKLVDERLKALKEAIENEWKVSSGNYRLDIETEIFWRRGSPPQR